MHPLLLRLASLRRRLWFVHGLRGLGALFGFFIGAAVLVGVVDYGILLPGLVRALVLVGVLGGGGFLFYRYLLQPFTTPTDDLSLALRVEAHFPELNDALGSAVQFMEAEDSPNSPGSAAMRKQAIAQTERLAEDCDFSSIVSHRGLWLAAAAAAVASLAAGYFLFHHTQLSATALARLVDPFGHHPWTRIGIEGCPHKIAVGQPYDVKAQFEGVAPTQAIIEIEALGLVSRRPAAIKRDADGRLTISERQDMTQHKGEFKFRILANDGVYPPGRNSWHEVSVLPPPRLVDLATGPSPQIELHLPSYTDLPSPVKLAPGGWQIDAPAGTRVRLRAAADKKLAQAWIEYRSENYLGRVSAGLAPLGALGMGDVLGGYMIGQPLWGRFHAVFEEDGKTFAIEFFPQMSGYYLLHIEDTDGLPKDYPGDLRVNPDPLPTVQLLRPGSSMSVLPDAELNFHLVVEDEQYAIRSVYLEYRVRDLEGKWLDDGPRRLDLYDPWGNAQRLPYLGAPLDKAAPPGPAAASKPKRLDLATRWPLQKQFKKDQIIVLHLAADDFCNLYPDRPAGRGHDVEIRIVEKEDLVKILDEGLADTQQELLRIQKMQEEALDLAREIQKKQEKAGNKEIDQIAEVEQLQKQVQERIGKTSEEGLRKQLAKLNQLIKDNKLPPSDVQDHIKTMKRELERLSQEDLQQIEPNLAEMRRELQNPKADPKIDPKVDPKANPKQDPKGAKTPLDKAVHLQKDVKNTLDELAKGLAPWASLQEVKVRTRDLLNKQKDLQQETNGTKNRQDILAQDPEKPGAGKIQEEINNNFAKIAEAQKTLGKRAEDLMDLIGKAQAKRAEQGDQDAVNKLKEANKVAKEGKLPQKLREVGVNLDQPEPLANKAIQDQQANVKNLEKMLAALENGNKDDQEKLVKKQKKAQDVQNKIDQIAQAQEKLQKKVKDAQKIQDPEARKDELKRLAEEQNKLKEEAKENARELSRLNEEKASDDLNQAAREMEKAGDKLAGGDNPEEEQKQALDRLEEAQNKLADFQEELAREQLAKIADRLEGLKLRQDEAYQRSAELHKKVVGRNKWSKGLLETLGGDQATQAGLAKEADGLREKIKEAKVFEHILSKAAQGMEEAAKIMDQRREDGKNRQLDALDKKDLADEVQRDEQTRKFQKQASQRLQRLLDALKNEPPQIARKPKKQDNKDPKGNNQEEPQNGIRPADLIPAMAQLKALRAEQLDVNERTKEFAQRHPDVNALDEAQRAELAVIHADQEKIRQLFGDLNTPKEKQGEQP